MKRTIRITALLLAIFAVFALTACTPDKPDVPKGTDAPGPADPTEANNSFAGKPFDENFDMAIVFDGKTYPIHCSAHDLIAVLGDDYDYNETISCTREGYEKTYEYDGLRIDTLPDGDGDIVGLFVITGSRFSTPRNITVGSTREELVAAYGDNYYDDDYYLIFTKSNDPSNISEMRIQVVLENDVVTEINVYAPDYSN